MPSIKRRTVLTGAAVATSATALGVGGYELLRKPGRSESSAAGGNKPNILVIVVDQMRASQWFPESAKLAALLPNIARLQRNSLSFDSHYTASNMCTPSRGVMTTGLYSHQTGCLFTGAGPTESSLSPQFPTWGTMLREQGYRTWWWGKWHLGRAGDMTPEGLAAHGFFGGTFPSPNGAPHQGLDEDHDIVDQFNGWFDDKVDDGPWCTTVSLVNPHDICWWPKNPLPENVPHVFSSTPGNFETPDDLHRRNKPRLQLDYQDFMSPLMTGALSYSGPDLQSGWARCLDMYLWLQQQVDAQIGRVLDKLASRPEIDRNTVVVFTSDHGEYGGSHGLRGKGAAAYDEAIRVPLSIRDPHGHLTPKPGDTRSQLTSSVDLAPLLLTIGSGGNGWRSDPRYAYLAGRADLAAIAANASAPGRPWVAHVTDDMSVEEMETMLKSPLMRKVFGIKDIPTNIPTSAPNHIVAVRTRDAKLATYSYWKPGGMDIDTSRPIERELYDYSTPEGRQEVDNQAGRSAKEAELQGLIDHAVLAEVRAPLPSRLSNAQEQGLADMRHLVSVRGG
ncbi:sulfatase-like hydrolase/transferase [Candidatus Mycobacterium wuenschmannii]|uniref:Sulfatase-like hydrolase/transferase n=1 Tax=Candidatus Mycobacterium wuenschmannii TaxID=3027808 RepID=A0ABY8VUG9_9MYCO|nr:sulfatase-like hydrolase/transferase [Candidatus Mycobacterium wuenschmannii]WIM87152.1 sulfatase-like hydrolase/transferase [Candidatus Mycobacterium wuenschmannii]